MREEIYRAEPSVPQAFLELVLRRRGRLTQVPALPDEVFVQDPAVPRRDRLSAYRALLAPGERDALPVLYPHVMAGRLHLAMMGRPSFPMSMLGAVHTHTRVRRFAPISPKTPGVLRSWLGTASPVRSGLVFTLATDLVVEDEVVWSSENTYQIRGRFGEPQAGEPMARLEPPDPGRQTAQWSLPANLGRAYARICGDWNPIHISGPSARLLGFRRPIVHGYANLAMALGRIGVPDGPVTLDVAFKGPVPLGSRAWATMGEGGRFAVFSPADARPALVGRLVEGVEGPLHESR